MADGDLRRRRISQRLIKLKEARSESEASRMIKLKKEWLALLDRQRARVEADSKVIDAEFKALAEEAKARSAQAPPPPCDPLSAAPPPPPPCDPLSAAPPPPPPCDPFPPLSAPPPRARLAGKKTKKKFLKWKVPQERIDHMILNLRDPLNDRYPLERLRKRDQRFREFLPNVGLLVRRSSSTCRPSSSSSVKRDMQRTIPRPRRRTMARRLRWSITRTKLEAKALQHLRQIAQETSGDVVYALGRQPAVLRTFSQRLSR